MYFHPWKQGGLLDQLPGSRSQRFWREEFVTLDYDRETVIRQLSESGLIRHSPNWCKITEHDLRNPERELGHGNVLKRVMELCREDTGEWRWPDIPEKYWDLAMKEFGL